MWPLTLMQRLIIYLWTRRNVDSSLMRNSYWIGFSPELVLTYLIKNGQQCQILIKCSVSYSDLCNPSLRVSVVHVQTVLSLWQLGWCQKPNWTSANEKAFLNTADMLCIAQWASLLPYCKHLFLSVVLSVFCTLSFLFTRRQKEAPSVWHVLSIVVGVKRLNKTHCRKADVCLFLKKFETWQQKNRTVCFNPAETVWVYGCSFGGDSTPSQKRLAVLSTNCFPLFV